mmetsp:Transcript_18307/g.56146  ORF Transcript_18307/g.56146 Transcript_18307/m.56146 type:complete len:221 (+) Transcript_18307:164-826(+)
MESRRRLARRVSATSLQSWRSWNCTARSGGTPASRRSRGGSSSLSCWRWMTVEAASLRTSTVLLGGRSPGRRKRRNRAAGTEGRGSLSFAASRASSVMASKTTWRWICASSSEQPGVCCWSETGAKSCSSSMKTSTNGLSVSFGTRRPPGLATSKPDSVATFLFGVVVATAAAVVVCRSSSDAVSLFVCFDFWGLRALATVSSTARARRSTMGPVVSHVA